MQIAAFSLLCGLIFGAGLALSGMMNPALVLAFLDVTGEWNPTLGFVMVGALCVSFPAYAMARRRRAPMLREKFDIPTRNDIDAPLITGAALFGIGWGMAGFCPGPAISALGSGLPGVFVFVAAMIAGMALFRLVPKKS